MKWVKPILYILKQILKLEVKKKVILDQENMNKGKEIEKFGGR